LRQIREGVGPDVPIIWTVFSPLMIARFLLAGDAAELLEIARSEPDALSKALAAVAETVDGYVRLCLANGADGIFYATNLATRDHLTPDECQRFQRTHDLDVLASAGDAPFNVMHICGQDARLEAFVDYPVAAFSFALGPGNWTLSEAHRRTGKASMGGLPNHFAGVSASDLTSRARAAIDEMGGRWLLLAPECSIEPGTPEELLLAAGASPRSPESDVRGGGGPL
jgi:uroporphyrinogen decarboxylase